ncbi:MAG: NAD(P)/FAD-dependent oxidoreductase, partial [Bacillota bacterium]
MKTIDCVVVGAGLTGIMAARTLKDKGYEVLLIDKGKSVGGRMATRRLDGGKVDHGAQFFTVRTERFQSEVNKWLNQGFIKLWFGENHPRFISPDGMNALAKTLAKDLSVELKTEISQIEQRSDGYIVRSTTGEAMKTKAIMLTIPAPQAEALLMSSKLEINETAIKKLKQITFNPCLVGLFKLSDTPKLPENGHLNQDLPKGMMRIVDHSKKSISDERTVSVYMTGQWSKEYMDETSETVLNHMINLSKAYFDRQSILSQQLKRWRYAEAVEFLREPYLELSDKPPLMIAGDAFLSKQDPATHTRIESAFTSGVLAA